MQSSGIDFSHLYFTGDLMSSSTNRCQKKDAHDVQCDLPEEHLSDCVCCGHPMTLMLGLAWAAEVQMQVLSAVEAAEWAKPKPAFQCQVHLPSGPKAAKTYRQCRFAAGHPGRCLS